MTRGATDLSAARLAACLLVAAVACAAGSADDYQFVAKWGSRGTGDGQFWNPRDVATDASGNIYVADTDNYRIQKLGADGTCLAKWGSLGPGDGEFSVALWGVATDGSGNVYAADTLNYRIQRFSSTGAFLGKWGSQGPGDGQFDTLYRVAADAAGNVFAADLGSHRVQKFSSAGTFLGEWGSFGEGDEEFNGPCAVEVDSAGNVYVGDSNCYIRKFTANGAFLCRWGSAGSNDEQFGFVDDIAVNAWGNVYVVDSWNARVQVFTSTGAFLGKWGVLDAGDGGFIYPTGIAVDGYGNVFVSDKNMDRVQKFVPHRRLEWAGSTGYETDGVDPDVGDPDSTTFTFKVRYTDPSGAGPALKRVILLRREEKKWRNYKSLTLTKESGATATGAIYSCSTQLGNEVVRYYFRFKAPDGSLVEGEPAQPMDGPGIAGPPKLCWAGGTGYTTDGVSPDAGPPKTRFKFRVHYLDSEGDVPTTANVRVRRDGVELAPKVLTPWAVGDYRTGKTFQAWLAFGKPGALEYRFEFADDDGNATGEPTEWHTGPTLTSSGSGVVSALAAAPTNLGAQVAFSLAGAADVSATVLNIAGRPIRTLCADQACEAGMNTLVWNALSDRGLRVPSGAYLIRITARAGDGAQSSALATVAVR